MIALIVLWIVTLAVTLWWLAAAFQPEPEPAGPAPARDPVVEQVDKWMHDWDRGRA